MSPALRATHERLAVEAELQAGPCRFVRERLRLPMGIEASFGWLRHPPSVLVVPRFADGRILVLRRYRPVLGRWVLEFPSGALGSGESPPEGGARLMRRLTGHGTRGWQSLGVLRPNPGYSDECMTLALVDAEGVEAADGWPADCRLEEEPDGGLLGLWLCMPQALETALTAPEELVDGRCVSAWWLAKPHWSL